MTSRIGLASSCLRRGAQQSLLCSSASPGAIRHLQATRCARAFSASTTCKEKKDKAKEHATKKVAQGDQYDVQSDNAKSGMNSAKEQGIGGNATQQKDTAGSKSKAKREFPEAPDVAIGMQDERGTKGH